MKKSEKKSAPNAEKSAESQYEARGVSSKKEEVHQALAKVDPGLFPTAFCKIIEDVAQDSQYCSIMHADAVGTKCSVAYMMYQETGDLRYFRGLVHDAVVMNTDDLLCVGAIGPMLLSNTIERNKTLITGEILAAIIDEYEQFTKRLRDLGLPIITCGGETGDTGDLIRTITLGATVFTRMFRNQVIVPDKIQPGDVIVGLSSEGRATYEPELIYNSGIGSNGLTLARHGVLKHDYYTKYPMCFDPNIDPHYIFSGKFGLLDPLPGTSITIGEAILSPTRTYAPIIIPLLQKDRTQVHGIFHNTGGGQTKCIRFGKDVHYIKDNLFPTPPFFKAVQESSQTQWKEMYQVFNMGHRMEIVCPQDFANNQVIPTATRFQIKAKVIGRVEKSQTKGNQVTVNSENGTFEFRSS